MSIPRMTEILDRKCGFTNNVKSSTPVSISTTSATVAAANAKRKHVVIQNQGTEAVILRLSSLAASTSDYHAVLSKCLAARDGLGGSITVDNYQGAITGICESNTSVVSVMEIENE